jgi:hypothetical protein
MTVEISNVLPNIMLSAEFKTKQTISPQTFPQDLFRRRLSQS